MIFIKLYKLLRGELRLYFRLFKDKRTPVISKLMLIGALLYLLFPMDIIPDFIPLAGLVDEVIVIPMIFSLATMFIPKHVVEENKSKQNKYISAEF